MTLIRPRVVVAQMGARRHYAVPVLFHRAGMLIRLYTDSYAGKGWPRLGQLVPKRLRPRGLKQLLGRSCEIPGSKVIAFNRFGAEYAKRQRQAATRSQRTAVYLWAGNVFDQLVVDSGLNHANTVHAFESAALGLFQNKRPQGVRCILDKCSAPRQIYDTILSEEVQLWPGWETCEQDENASAYNDRIAQECDLAHRILAPSSFVIEGLVKSGVSRDKCRLIPFGIDIGGRSGPKELGNRSSRLRVLFVGRVQLMKGIQYLLQAAARMSDLVELRVVGAIGCNEERLRSAAPSHTQFLGHVPSIEVQHHYHWADVFCLPSLCEGSAAVTYEALANGLPVICTPNAGSVVRDGIDGFIVPVRDSDAIARRIELLASDGQLLDHLSRNARETAGEYTLSRYGERLTEVVLPLLVGD